MPVRQLLLINNKNIEVMEEKKSEEKKKKQKSNSKRIAEGVFGALTLIGALVFKKQLNGNNNNKA